MGGPIDFVFDSTVAFLRTVDRLDLLPVGPKSSNPKWWLAAILKISNEDISGMGHPIYFMLDFRCVLSAASEPHRLPTCLFII